MTANADAERTGSQSGEATRVRLSFRALEAPADADEWPLADDEWIRDGLREETYLGYLRRVHAGPVAAGDEFEEFVNGGCGRVTDVTLRVETVEGGGRLGPETALEVVHRSEV